jgi:ribonuclease HI
MKFIVHTDGGSRGNPGNAAVGIVIENEVGRKIVNVGKTIGIKTNNEAEYMAVITAFSELKAHAKEIGTVEFVLDSLLVVNQLNGLFKVKKSHLQELLFQIRVLENDLGKKVTYRHVLRGENIEADRLVNEALDSA